MKRLFLAPVLATLIAPSTLANEPKPAETPTVETPPEPPKAKP